MLFLFLLILFFQGFVFQSQGFIIVDESIDFLIEDVNVSEEIVVLLLSFDEGILDLLDVGQSSGFFDGVEGLIDHFHVTLVVVNQFDFFLVVEDKFGESVFEDRSCIVLNGLNLSGFDSAASV